MTPVIELHDVTLSYRLNRSSATSLKEAAIHALTGQVRHETLTALREVSCLVRPGEVLAVIGSNGAGKSTLMKVIARVLPPSSGRVLVRGRTAPMIELGAGFNFELTGFENTMLYGTLLGGSPQALRRRAPAIAEWAGLADYLNVPLRSYSSGMITRLAFAIAVDSRPDVLVVDEVLSVGDEAFRRKSAQRMDDLIESGSAVVLVSHDMSQVLERASRVMWLERGAVRREGLPEEVVAEYRAWV